MKNRNWTQKEKQVFSALHEGLKSRFGEAFKEIRVFGSRIKGGYTSESDLDVVILLDTTIDWRSRKEIHFLLADINLEYDVILSARIFSLNQWKNPGFQVTPLFQSITREGILV